jgi:uncharacterized protein
MSQSAHEVIGEVVSLWRYPVKSMMGEELHAAEVGERGLLGDRAYALLDASDGKVASAKNPSKWPQIFQHRAAFVEPPRSGAKMPAVRVTLPDGTVLTSDEAGVQEALSRALGREVTLEAAAETPGPERPGYPRMVLLRPGSWAFPSSQFDHDELK